MKFNDFDKMMREFEESLDQYVPETSYMVARLDGRGFTKLTKDFEKPFSGQFHDMMVKTVHALMTCGFNVLYGYTQSDEISLLFDPNERAFNRLPCDSASNGRRCVRLFPVETGRLRAQCAELVLLLETS